MTGADLNRLLRCIVDNNIKEAYKIVESMTMQERAVLAEVLAEGAKFLIKVNKDWCKAFNYPAENEE